MAPRSLLRRTATLASALPLLGAFPLYRLVVRLLAEIGPWRTLGLLQVLAAAALALALLTAACLPAPRRAARWLVPLVACQLGLIGLTIWYGAPRSGPVASQWGALAMLAAFGVAFWRKPEAEQAFVARVLLGAGGLAWVGLALPLPLVGWQALAERGLPAIAPAAPPANAARPDRPTRVVLLTVDGLRYRSARALPNLARLASRSDWYTQARSVTDATIVSMPAILTGASIPQWVQARAGGASDTVYLREGRLTGLAGYLAPAGYQAYYATMLIQPGLFGIAHEFAGGSARASGFLPGMNAFNTRAFLPLSPLLGYARGFPELPPDGPGAIDATLADALAAYRRNDPYVYVWAHLGGAHAPFRPMEHLPGGRLRPTAATPVYFWDVPCADAAGLRRIEAAYEENVRYLDQELGAFLAALQADPRWGSTLLVLTADHGQDFRLHATPHGTGHLTKAETRVPLLIHAPGQQAGRQVAGLATSYDVAPSVLARVYAEPPRLAGLALGTPPAERIIYAWGLYHRYSEHTDRRQVVAAFQGPYRYTRAFPAGDETLVDWTAEPPRPVTRPEVFARLRDYVRRELPLPGVAAGR